MLTPLLTACATVLRESLERGHALSWHLWLEGLRDLTGADACSLMQLEDGELVPLAAHGLSPDTLGRRFPLAAHPRLQAIVSSAEVLRFPADSPLPDPFDGLIPSAGDDLHVHDCAGVRISGTEGPLGVLTIDALRSGTFDAGALSRLAACAQLAAACMQVITRVARLHDAVDRQQLVSSALMEELRPGQQLLGRSPAMRALLKEIHTVAHSDLPVLILGETGTGKELVARALHYNSPRRSQPLISLNCAALPESLIESELFGHVVGAFSGATANRRGKFEIADGGTLFLDEVGELSPAVQPKLLRALQSGEIQRVGSDEHIKVNVRILAATNRDLAAEVRAGRFRADLFHRVSIYPLHVPPLRERGRDVLLLAGNVLERNRASLQLRSLRLAPEAQRALLQAAWPGNVRELEHAISRGALKAAAEGLRSDRIVTIEARHLDLQAPPAPVRESPAQASALPAGIGLAEATLAFQRQLIESTLAREQGNWAAAARALAMDRGNFRRLARRVGARAPGH